MQRTIILLLIFAISSCTPAWQKALKNQIVEAPTEQADIDRNLILQYALDKELEVQSTESGIYYVMEKEGTGDDVLNAQSKVVAHYHGMLLDGTVFDSSVDRGEPFTFGLNRVIKGWQEAIPLLKKGGKGKFIIPSALAYGERGSAPKIPANTVLIFDIELIDIVDSERDAKNQAKADQDLIMEYAKSKQLDLMKTPDGIHYMIEKEGEGTEHPNASSVIIAHYHGMLLDGTVFDSSVKRGEPIEFELGGVIKGWQKAIPMLTKGGKGKFVIPSGLAYGARGVGSIPKNSVLIFDIELIDFYDKSKQIEHQAAVDETKIQEYIKTNNLTTKKTASGIHYIIEKPGVGVDNPTLKSNITAHYHGTFLDGKVFDSSVERGDPFPFQLGGVIKGWQEAVPLLKKGGKGKFIIPSGMAYGPRGAGQAVPKNAVLIFEIELIDFE